MKTAAVASTILAPRATVSVDPRATTSAAAKAPICFTKPGAVDLCVYRGDSGRVRVRLTDTLGAPIDVTEAVWDCDFRTVEDATVVLCSLTIEQVAGSTNTVDIVLSPTDSAALNADCVWDLEMTLDGEVTTVLAGKVMVTKDVSRPT